VAAAAVTSENQNQSNTTDCCGTRIQNSHSKKKHHEQPNPRVKQIQRCHKPPPTHPGTHEFLKGSKGEFDISISFYLS
jgi:hypothetical protein